MPPWCAGGEPLRSPSRADQPREARSAHRANGSSGNTGPSRTTASASPRSRRISSSSQYRAGRYEAAIGRLEEAIQARGGEHPGDWPFLALAHHRLGHRDEARRWLERLREHQPDPAPAQFWVELEIRLLRSEAEAVVLYDTVFPEDPFAR